MRRGRACWPWGAVVCRVAGRRQFGAGRCERTGCHAAHLVGWAEEVPGLATLNTGGNAPVTSVSCWRAGDCAAGGFYTDASQRQQAFVVTQANGPWGTAEEVPGTAALNAGGGAQVLSVSCPPGGGCAAGGYYSDKGGNRHAFVVAETNGPWRDAEEVPGTGKLNVGGLARVRSVSCPWAGKLRRGRVLPDLQPAHHRLQLLSGVRGKRAQRPVGEGGRSGGYRGARAPAR